MRRSFRVVLTALSPISHGAFGDADIGNAVAIRREPIVSLPGFPRVPCISGNALRGCTRRIVMREMFERAGISRAGFEADGKSREWDRLYAALANGGHLEASEKRVDPAKLRALREAMPPLSVFGAALYSYLLQGGARFGIAWPRCRATHDAGLVSTRADVDHEELVEETSFTRHIDRELQDPTQSGVTPMPVTVEALSTGTVLEADIEFSGNATAIERGAVAYSLDALTAIGGKSGAGLGRVRVTHDGADDAAAYRAWLDGAAPRLGDVLRSLARDLAAAGNAPEKPARGKKAAAAQA